MGWGRSSVSSLSGKGGMISEGEITSWWCSTGPKCCLYPGGDAMAGGAVDSLPRVLAPKYH